MEGSESTIGALLDETGGSIKTGPFGTKLKASEYTATGVPVISVGEVGFGRLRVHHDTPRVDDTVSSRMPEYLLKAGDIVFGRKGAVERSAQVQPDEDGYFLGSDGIRIRLNVEECDPKFISYQLQTTAHRSWMIQHAAGTTMPSLNEGIIRRIPIVLKPLAEQKAIAAVLGALDDKIELNRRMNTKLEEMARALFQSWFVDFDPVRAKLDAWQSVGLDPATAALFPSNLEESPLGPIPQGWEVGRLDDVLTLQRGFDLPTYDRTHGKYPVMAASGLNGCHDKYMVRGPGVTTGRSGVLGRVFFIHGDFWPLNTSLWVKEFKLVTTAYAYHLLLCLDFEMFNAGSAVPTLNRNHVHNLPVLIPPMNIVEAFDSQVMRLMKLQKVTDDESSNLANLRDTMLPQLLNGGLKLKKSYQSQAL